MLKKAEISAKWTFPGAAKQKMSFIPEILSCIWPKSTFKVLQVWLHENEIHFIPFDGNLDLEGT